MATCQKRVEGFYSQGCSDTSTDVAYTPSHPVPHPVTLSRTPNLPTNIIPTNTA